MHRAWSTGHAQGGACNTCDTCARPQFVEGRLQEGAYEQRIRESRFCLAPYGHGYGMRLGQCIFAGSIPVIVQVKLWQLSVSGGFVVLLSTRPPSAACLATGACVPALGGCAAI